MGETPELKEWREKVGGAGFGEKRVEAREQFYARLAVLKTEVPNIDAVVDRPKDFGLKAFEDVKKYEGLARDISKGKYKPRSGETLYETLVTYFRKNLEGEITDKKLLKKQVDKEVALTMHYLGSKQRDTRGRKINVDLVRRGETVEIRDGRLYIYRKDAEGNVVKTRVEGAYLRKPPAGAAPETPPPSPEEKLTMPLPLGDIPPPKKKSQEILIYPEQKEHEKELIQLRDRMAEIERTIGDDAFIGGLRYGTFSLRNEILAQVDSLRTKPKNDQDRQRRVADFRKRIADFEAKITELKRKLIDVNNEFRSFKVKTAGKRNETVHTINNMMKYLDEGGIKLTDGLFELMKRTSRCKGILDRAGL